ncbi:MAG: hypothetical protein IPJ21_14425 [Sterolibacteriaceae bacterium]|nr:hypothetical protein [Sterolibacteriaceae bacterium]
MPFISRRRSSYQQGDKRSCAVPTPLLASAIVAAGIGLLAAVVITMLFDTTPGRASLEAARNGDTGVACLQSAYPCLFWLCQAVERRPVRLPGRKITEKSARPDHG